jgi:hypothetical protein
VCSFPMLGASSTLSARTRSSQRFLAVWGARAGETLGAWTTLTFGRSSGFFKGSSRL